MADFQPAVEATLENEGGFSYNNKTGEVVNFGITLGFARAFLKSNADVNFIKFLARDQAIDAYRQFVWDRNHIGDLQDQRLAAKVFDLSVNMGAGTAVRLLQEAADSFGGFGLTVDGRMGPNTIAVANSLSASCNLYGELISRAADRYMQIAENPALAPDLNGWLARLGKG